MYRLFILYRLYIYLEEHTFYFVIFIFYVFFLYNSWLCFHKNGPKIQMYLCVSLFLDTIHLNLMTTFFSPKTKLQQPSLKMCLGMNLSCGWKSGYGREKLAVVIDYVGVGTP